MTALFEFLFKYRPLIFERGTLAFHPLWPPYVTLFLIALALAGSYLIYRRTAGFLSPSWLYLFAGLRAAALSLVILLFLQPVLRLRSVIPQKNFVAVAYDLSRSMEIRDEGNGQSRLEVVKHLLRPSDNPLLSQLAAKFKVRFFRFSGTAERSEAFGDIPHHGSITNIERTLNQIAGELSTAPIAGIILITDGADNRSKSLDSTAAQFRARNIPVYPIGIGSADFSRDTELLRVTAPKRVLKDTVVEAEVSVRSTGYAGRRAKLLVLDQNRLLQNQEITLGSNGEVKTYRISFNSQSAGPRVFRFRLEPFPDEVVQENNEQTILVRVDNGQPQILYVEGEPRWEYGFLRRAILQDKNLRVVTLLRQADGKFLRQGVESSAVLQKGFPTDKNELFPYKAVILGSVEASFFTFDQLRMISDFVSRRGGGFLMLGGRNSFGQGGYLNTPIEDLLPVSLGRAGAIPEFQDLEYKVRLTSYGWQHPITRLSLSEDQNRKRWESAPALMGFNPVGALKPGATLLAQGSAPDSGGQNPVILAFQRFGRGKSVALTTASTWRWKMGLDHTDNFHELFWKQMLRWLVSDVPDPVGIAAEKHSYSLDDTVLIQAEANDSSFLPVNNAQINARVKAPSGEISSVPMVWDPEKDGVYSGTFKPHEEGIYEVSAEGLQGNKSLGNGTANFRIAESAEEFHNAALNSALLKRLADETGGRYYSPDNSRTLAEDISYIDKGSSRIEEKDLWDMPLLFLLLAGLVSTEWTLRKRKGLK
jgi:uncharacterized membrane protein